ncbi:serine/threonine-protein phosphatase 6 regulatory ankyrin repeat subunit A-like [Saccostrea cucullata]|uniref:serine/threonine-protein phosphatase 6 regulatory ankyrin repeat subunit A-like n=1 Tax=Saccostrea cuccullata TaxID=36930 RepID=UPI002ED1B31F
MLNKVRGQPYMTFVGVPGSGKSATIHHIALILQEEGYEVIPIMDISEIYRYCDSRNHQVFVIDDVVGVLGLQKQKLETLVDYEKIISDPIKRTKVLMSCREAVFNECYKSFFLNEENIVKMFSSENTLNDDDKKAILQKHGLDKDLLSPSLLREVSAMFPLLCKLFSKEEKFRNDVERFFTCPAGYILEELDKMKEQNRLQYATLVLCLLNDNKISNKILKDTGNKTFCEMKSKALELCKVKSYTDAFEFVDALSVMEGTYTKLCGTEYTFIHDSMFEIIAYHFGSKFPDLILQFMSSSYIANSVKLQKNEMLKLENEQKQASENDAINSESKNEKNIACKKEGFIISAENGDRMESFDLCIRIGKDQYSMLAERLYRDIENMELYDVFMNNILKHSKVCEAFIEVLKTKPYTELKSLFLSVQKDVSKVVSKGKRVREGIEKRDKRSREWSRQRVLVNAKYDNKEITYMYSVRVISCVVYYGHNKILEYILDQTDSHKETQFEFFLNSFNLTLIYSTKQMEKNTAANNQIENLWTFTDLDIDGSISEHQRLVLLSCYNGDLETVRICIKYMKRNTIYMTFPGIDFKYVLGDKALEASCEGGHLSVVKELVEAGADVNPQGVDYTPLTTACKGGYTSIVKELIEAGADINRSGVYCFHFTPLTAACKGGYIGIVKELLGAGADVNRQGKHGIGKETPLTVACECGHFNIVRELLEAGADMNQKGGYGTPLTAAGKGGHLNILRELLMAGADVNLQGKYDTPLVAACDGGHLNILRELRMAGADVNQQGKYDTPLTAACKGGHINLVKELMETGADVNTHGYIDTPLTAAIKSGNMIIVKELLRAGADVNPQDKFGTPLIAACEGEQENFVKELLDAGADVNLHSTHKTPLIAACYGGHMSIVMQLLKAGADVNLQIKSCTSLIAACWGGHEGVVEEIVNAGADVNLRGTCNYYNSLKVGVGKVFRKLFDKESYSPLTLVCGGGYMSGVKTLLKAGADVNPQGEYLTPLIAAIKGGYISIIKELLSAGADVNLQGKHKTPLIAACDSKNMNIVMQLLNRGVDVNLRGKDDTPLVAACKYGHVVVVKELLQKGANVNLQCKHKTPLTVACDSGHMNIELELMNAGADVNLHNGFHTPLTAACAYGHVGVVKELLQKGADVNLHGKHNTPLTLACRNGYMSIVVELLKAGADVNLQGKYNTPMTVACNSGYTSIVMELIKTGADVNLQGECDTPLTAACERGHKRIVVDLLKAGADVNLRRRYDCNTPLTAACKKRHLSVVIELLKAGADVNLQGKYDTPLITACRKNYVVIAKTLLDAKSDVNMQDRYGNTPLYIAFVNINKIFIPVILQLFYIYGADSAISNKEGISSFFIALIRYKTGSVKELIRTEKENQIDRLKLHSFECLVNIKHSDVMTDSKDDVVVTRRRVWRMKSWGDLYKEIIRSDCKGL